MPIVNGQYVAPTWVNDSAPALDADELNAMSSAIEGLPVPVKSGSATGSVVANDVSNNVASGNYSFAEGVSTQALTFATHAEGSNCVARTQSSHCEGVNTTTTPCAFHITSFSGDTIFIDTNQISDIELVNIGTKIKFPVGGSYEVTQKSYNSLTFSQPISSSDQNMPYCYSLDTGDIGYSHAEGQGTVASRGAHAECAALIAGDVAHAEGESSCATGRASHSEGFATQSTGNYSHAEGYKTTASGNRSHAEGSDTTASGLNSHASGSGTTASGVDSHAEGYESEAAGNYSSAHGSTIASGTYQATFGAYNRTFDNVSGQAWLIVGSGNSSANANAFRVASTAVYGGTYNTSGADYAEMFEWADENPDGEDRAGRFVTLEGDRIRIAEPDDGFVLGIVSGAPSVCGGVYDDQWQGMYVRDVFGRYVWEEFEVPEETMDVPDPEDPKKTVRQVIVPARRERRIRLDPGYDAGRPYVPRSERDEWDAVGMLGKLVAVDDGSCEADGWAAVGKGGIAVKSEARTKYRVLSRLDDTHVRILIL